MPDNLIGELRRSSVLMTYAPGAVMDMRHDGAPISAIHAGLEEWDYGAPLTGNLRDQRLFDRRLCKKLRKKYFRLPPVLAEGAKYPHSEKIDTSALVARRFPSWLQCPVCETVKRAARWQADPGQPYRYCQQCSGSRSRSKKVFVVPIRFVVACTHGHLDDFPWSFWLKHTSDCSQKEEYRLFTTGAGLAGLRIKCLGCKQERSLDGVFSKTALSGLHCKGNRPWLRTNDERCSCNGKDGTYRVIQRGASNLYYPVVESALDIPPWTEQFTAILGDYWSSLEGIESRAERIQYCRLDAGLKALLHHEQKSADWLVDRFEEALERLEKTDVSDLRPDEYDVFTAELARQDLEFEIYPEEVPDSLRPFIGSVVRVTRLREVRVVTGFTRIFPSVGEESDVVSPLSTTDMDWLPAIEVRGEGVFVSLNADSIREWERRPEVIARCASANASWLKEWATRYPDKKCTMQVSPRLLLVHTLSHALIKQLTLECGYSSASLRERLYVSSEGRGMAGLLIYTSAPDSDGTLGGLQRRAAPDLFEATVKSALSAMDWCSADPLCIVGSMAPADSHSISSCHACTMLPETSCELHNRFMDRGLIVTGGNTGSSVNYFAGLE